MSSPILYSVWERWETILLNPGRAKSNGIRTTIISAKWIELMDNLWNSSGRFSQDSPQWESSMRFNRWENYSVNQRASQAGSSSCQYLTTLYGMQQEMMNCLWIIQRQLKSMLKDSLAVIGLSWGLELKRSGTELTIANQMDLGTELQRKCCSTSKDPVILHSVVPMPWREESQEAEEEERHQYTSLEVRKTLSFVCCFSGWSSPSITSVFTEQWRTWMKNYQLVRKIQGNPLHQVNWINKKFSHNLLSQMCKPMKSDRETRCKNTSNDLKNCQKTRSYPDYAPKQVWD